MNAKLHNLTVQLIAHSRSDYGFNDHFNPEKYPKVVEALTKGPMAVAKQLKKERGKFGGLGICTLINPWRDHITDGKKIKW